MFEGSIVGQTLKGEKRLKHSQVSANGKAGSESCAAEPGDGTPLADVLLVGMASCQQPHANMHMNCV